MKKGPRGGERLKTNNKQQDTMRAIRIKSMTLGYFKGVKSMEIGFGDRTVVRGTNATGKTTVFDAFTWCLFGKDSTGKTDFELKTIENGRVVEKVSCKAVRCAVYYYW